MCLCELTCGLCYSQFEPSPQREGGIQEGIKKTRTDGLVTIRTRESDFTDFTANLQPNCLVSLEPLTLNAATDDPLDDGTCARKPLRCILDLSGFEEASSLFGDFLRFVEDAPSFLLLFSCSVRLLETKICMSLFFAT